MGSTTSGAAVSDREPVVPKISADVLYNRFHAHLDECQQCEQNPFALCPVGHAALMAWGAADTRANLQGAALEPFLFPDDGGGS